MAKEIERKFLVKNLPSELTSFQNFELLQGYIPHTEAVEERERMEGSRYFIVEVNAGENFKPAVYFQSAKNFSEVSDVFMESKFWEKIRSTSLRSGSIVGGAAIIFKVAAGSLSPIPVATHTTVSSLEIVLVFSSFAKATMVVALLGSIYKA